jgi:glycosyltransferase involved in cell wall biosynthesis
MIRLHLPAIPHTITHDDFSHCAFTGKVKRFSPMMRSRGFEVIHYGTEGSDSGANRDVQLFTRAEWQDLRIRSLRQLKPELDSDEKAEAHLQNPQSFYGDLANWSTPLYEEFNRRFKAALLKDYRKPDLVCIPLGHSYDAALSGLDCIILEFGIGYSGSCKNFRVFESHSWMSKTLTEENKSPQNYWFVVPHSFNIIEFPFSRGPSIPTVGFMARITACKGANIVVEIAKRLPGVQFVLCGQGDPTPYMTQPNIVYKGPIHGDERGRFLGGLTAFLAPTTYLEPFGAAMVEAQLCGTPVICSDWGGMSETVEHWKTGLRCHTLADYCVGVQMALDGTFDRTYIRDRAVQKYDMYRVAKDYEYVIRSVLDVYNGRNGWYSPISHIDPDAIPNVILQTSKGPLAPYISDMICKHATGWVYKHFTDNDIVQFFKSNPHPEFPNIEAVFRSFKRGEHKADLFRYYYLYLFGGVYLDSDAMLYMPIRDIVRNHDFVSIEGKYTFPNTVFQGFLCVRPRHPILYEALRHAYATPPADIESNYSLFCIEMFKIYNTHKTAQSKLYYERMHDNKQEAYAFLDDDRVFLRHYWYTGIVPQEVHQNGTDSIIVPTISQTE